MSGLTGFTVTPLFTYPLYRKNKRAVDKRFYYFSSLVMQYFYRSYLIRLITRGNPLERLYPNYVSTYAQNFFVFGVYIRHNKLRKKFWIRNSVQAQQQSPQITEHIQAFMALDKKPKMITGGSSVFLEFVSYQDFL